MYRKDDAPSRSSILLSSKEYNSTEELKNRARIREERREKFITMFKSATERKRKQQEENIESLSEARRETKD